MSTTPDQIDLIKTPIGWPLRLWMVAEIGFGVAAIATIFLKPQNTATNFAWPIQPAVMAAVLGAFYLASAIIMVLPLFAHYWQNVRVIIIPIAAFAAAMLLATLLHWDKFSLGTRPFYVWFASYLLPPPAFGFLYFWHQRRAAPVGQFVEQPLPRSVLQGLRFNGLAIAALAALFYVAPLLLQAIAPWQMTPLTVRTLCGWLLGIGLLQVSMALEGDWSRIRLGTPMLIVLPLGLGFQLIRFSEQVQWGNPALWLLLLDLIIVSLLLAGLWLLPSLRYSSGHSQPS